MNFSAIIIICFLSFIFVIPLLVLYLIVMTFLVSFLTILATLISLHDAISSFSIRIYTFDTMIEFVTSNENVQILIA